MTAISVIVPARDAAATLGATLDGLAAQEGVDGGFEVIVVDNGSHDATPEIAAAHPLRPRVLRRPRGEGPGAARNDGAAAAAGEIIAFTDSDCVPTPRWLAEGLRAFGRAGADIVQGAVHPQPGVPIGPFDHTLWVGAEVGLYETANLFVRRSVLEREGGFRDFQNSGRPFGEDAWFVWRARRSGARTAFCPEALVHHAVFPGRVEEYLRERCRDGLFAQLATAAPELREVFFYRRVFLSRRSAAFDAAALGVMAALVRRSPLPLLAGLPYARLAAEESRRRTGVLSKKVALAVAAGDAVGAWSLLRGSIAARSPVL